MAIQTQITRLSNAKTNIKNEIAKLGITIPSTVKIDQYYTYIEQYVLDFNNRLKSLENNQQEALYFDSTVNMQSSTVEQRLSSSEELEKNKIYVEE